MATANKIISTSLRLLEVLAANEPLEPAEGNDGLIALNDLLDSWTNEDLMQFFRPQRVIPLVDNKAIYTIGTGGDFNVNRPVSIENAFVRDTRSDWPIEEINDDQYQLIILKATQSTYPLYFYHEPDFPLGKIHLWPVPGPNLEMHISVRNQLDVFADINTNVDFPPGYVRALKYNLAVEIAPEYGKAISPLVREQAKTSKEGIKDTNNKNIPVLVSELTYWDINDRLSQFAGIGGGGAVNDGVSTFTETGTASVTITETGNESIVITEIGVP